MTSSHGAGGTARRVWRGHRAGAARGALPPDARAAGAEAGIHGRGFYTWFTCPPELRSDALSEEAVRGPAAAFGIDYPERSGALFFLVYTKDGLIDFLEGASSGMWYDDSASVGCWPGTMDPIVFDPAVIEMG